MEMIGYLISVFIVALGIFLGIFLGYIAKEELKPGKKYFALMQTAIIIAMVILSVYFGLRTYISVMLAFILLVWLDNKKITKEPKPRIYYVLYAIFAFLFFEASNSPVFIAFDSLIFLFGLPTGSLMFMKKKWAKNPAALSVLFFVLSVVLFILLETLRIP